MACHGSLRNSYHCVIAFGWSCFRAPSNYRLIGRRSPSSTSGKKDICSPGGGPGVEWVCHSAVRCSCCAVEQTESFFMSENVPHSIATAISSTQENIQKLDILCLVLWRVLGPFSQWQVYEGRSTCGALALGSCDYDTALVEKGWEMVCVNLAMHAMLLCVLQCFTHSSTIFSTAINLTSVLPLLCCIWGAEGYENRRYCQLEPSEIPRSYCELLWYIYIVTSSCGGLWG